MYVRIRMMAIHHNYTRTNVTYIRSTILRFSTIDDLFQPDGVEWKCFKLLRGRLEIPNNPVWTPTRTCHRFVFVFLHLYHANKQTIQLRGIFWVASFIPMMTQFRRVHSKTKEHIVLCIRLQSRRGCAYHNNRHRLSSHID